MKHLLLFLLLSFTLAMMTAIKAQGQNKPADSTETYVFAEQMPEATFNLQEYLKQAIRYPSQALRNEVQGRVYVNFVVTPQGKIGEARVVKGIGYGCDEEAVRVIKAMPDWKPGKQAGKAVPVRISLPVFFKLEYAQAGGPVLEGKPLYPDPPALPKPAKPAAPVESEAQKRERMSKQPQDTSDWASSRTFNIRRKKHLDARLLPQNLGLKEWSVRLNTRKTHSAVQVTGIPAKAESYLLFLDSRVYQQPTRYHNEDKPRPVNLPYQESKAFLFTFEQLEDNNDFDLLGNYALQPFDSTASEVRVGKLTPLTRAKLNEIFLDLQGRMPMPDVPKEAGDVEETARARYQLIPARPTLDYHAFFLKNLRYNLSKLPGKGIYRGCYVNLAVRVDTLGNVVGTSVDGATDYLDTAMRNEVMRLGYRLPRFKPAVLNRNPAPDVVKMWLRFHAPQVRKPTFDSLHVPYMYRRKAILENRLRFDYEQRAYRDREAVNIALLNANLMDVTQPNYYDRLAIPLRPLTLQYYRNDRAIVILPDRRLSIDMAGSTLYIPREATGYLLVLEDQQTVKRFALIPFTASDRAVKPTEWKLLDDKGVAQLQATLQKAVK